MRCAGSSLAALLIATGALAGCAGGPREQTVYYHCASGLNLTVVYRGTRRAIVNVPPRVYAMHAAPTPLGRRYVGDGLQWVARDHRKAHNGALYTNGDDGEPGKIAERCTETDRD